MKIIKYGEIDKTPISICLGYFDALHIGHTKIISKAKEMAEKKGLKVYVLIFTGGKNQTPDIFTFSERLIKLKSLGVDGVIYQKLSKDFMGKSKQEFLDDIFNFYNPIEIFVGEDFTYGKMAEGDIYYLKDYCEKNNAILNVLEKVVDEKGNKISSNNIKTALLSGDILLANRLLGCNYFIREKVLKGKGLGTKLDFPTANMIIESDKLLVKEGVYLTCTIIDHKLYSCLTNVGSQPTVYGNNIVVETYIDGFNGDLYEKTLSIYFIEKIRDIIKFKSLGELKEQLTKDLRWLK